MHDPDLYKQVLGLQEPWFVDRVELKVTEERVDIWVAHHSEVRWSCPKCGLELACRDHAEERAWRHLDTCQFKTYLHARIPRVECPEHGVLQVTVSWAEARSRFTMLMERLVIDVLRQCATVEGACRLMRVSWDEAWGVMERAVTRGQARKQRRVIPYVGWMRRRFARDIKIRLRTGSTAAPALRILLQRLKLPLPDRPKIVENVVQTLAV